MKIKSIYIIIAIAALCAQTLSAQTKYLDQITIENKGVIKKGNETNVAMSVNLNNLNINKNHMIVLTPVIASLTTDNTKELPPVIIMGNTRNKVLNRPYNWNGKPAIHQQQGIQQLVRKNGTAQSINYMASTLFEGWQRNAKLLVKTEVIGCADCNVENEQMTLVEKILPEAAKPQYTFQYITPEVEQVKQRSEKYSASFSYRVGKHDLLPNFENNAQELAKVDRIIRELQGNSDLQITDFTISGYASPEGSFNSNMTLSKNRAMTFAKFLEKKYGYQQNQFKVEWFGEDWKGLREAVTASSLSNKQDIIDIIDNSTLPDGKDAQLIALDNRQTYNRLLNELYPPLRRNEYNVAFIARAFDVNEAKAMLKKNPKLLSLNEMFLVANTYTKGSPEYNEVFRIASEVFPNDKTALVNAAINHLENNNADAAIKLLEKIKNTPEGANLLGVAYAVKGMNEKARENFAKAAKQNSANAKTNLEQLEKYIKESM